MKRIILVLASVMHLLPHPFGVSSIGALAIYGGAHADRKFSWLIPALPLLAGHLLFGFYDVTVMLFVYVGFGTSALLASFLLGQKRSGPRLAVAVATGAFAFFLISNYSIWLVGMYPPTMAGLIACYLNGLPYLATALLADGLYSLIFFGLHRNIDRQQWHVAAA